VSCKLYTGGRVPPEFGVGSWIFFTNQNFKYEIACITIRGDGTEKNSSQFTKTLHFKQNINFSGDEA